MLQPIDSTLAVEAALHDLRELLSLTGTRIQHEELPIVHGRASLLKNLFTTLLRHQIGDPAPDAMIRGSIQARFDHGSWQFTVQLRDLAASHSLGDAEAEAAVAQTCREILDGHGGRLEGVSRSPNAHCAIFRLPAAPRHDSVTELEGGSAL